MSSQQKEAMEWMQMLSLVGTSVAAAVLASLLLAMHKRRSSKKILPPRGVSMDEQAVQVKGKPGVYKCGYLEGSEETLVNVFPEVRTLYDVFLRGLQVSENGPCLGERHGNGPYSFLTYAEVFRFGEDFGSALVGYLGLGPGNESRVGIYARNCPRWFVSALGCVSQSMVVVPLYDTLGAEAANFIVQQAEIQVIVVDSAEKAEQLLASKVHLPTLKHIIVADEHTLSHEIVQEGNKAGVTVHAYSTVLEKGGAKPAKPLLPQPDDTYIICYTSGTTGTPKGVILTHQNLSANLSAFTSILTTFMDGSMTHEDVLISYLPLSHMMEQMDHWAMILYGASIGYFRGNIKQLTDDIKELRPTIFPAVPRLLNRLYDTIMAKVASSGLIGRTLFSLAYKSKASDLKKGIMSKDTIWDRLIFGKIQAELGGRVRLMATGSAPISAEVLQTCRVALGSVIVEAYGQTECTALATATWPCDWEAGHCGGPCTCATIKLADVAEMNYFAKDGKGEVLIKGPSVTKGYFRDPQKTAELFDEDGFLKTGDIGWIQPNGSLRIIDRKKHIFKLAQGEYVAPEKIENVYVRTAVVQQVYVDGDSLERWLIAVVVPEPDPLQEWDALHNGRGKRSLEDICRDPKAQEFVLNQLHKIGKENKLNSIEQVKKVILEADPFSVENGLLTPTLKAKRPQLRMKYKEAMASVYQANPTL